MTEAPGRTAIVLMLDSAAPAVAAARAELDRWRERESLPFGVAA